MRAPANGRLNDRYVEWITGRNVEAVQSVSAVRFARKKTAVAVRECGARSISELGAQFGADDRLGTLVVKAAPPKNKKTNLWLSVAVNRPPPRAYEVLSKPRSLQLSGVA